MRIGFDVMGGDYAPKEAVAGAVLAHRELKSGERIVLIGDKDSTLALVKEHGLTEADFDFVHTSEVIGMDEHPTKAISQKRDSSISVGFSMLAQKQLDAFASAVNTKKPKKKKKEKRRIKL
jgi:phosphate acyltransferase